MTPTEKSTVADRIHESISQRMNPALVLILPIAVYEFIFFLLPMGAILRTSFYEHGGSGNFIEGTWTLTHYTDLLLSSHIHQLTLFTFKAAIITTLVTVLFSIVYSTAIWRAEGALKNLLIISVVIPFLTTLVVRLFALNVILAPIGPLNDAILATGIIDDPLQLMHNPVGVYVGLIYSSLPYGVLIIYGVIYTVQEDAVEAARDLGASRLRAFYEVVLPDIMPGVIVAAVLTFAYSIGAYASPVLLGSSRERTLAVQVENLMLTQFNWPAGSALSVLIMVIVLTCVMLIMKYLQQMEGGDFAQ